MGLAAVVDDALARLAPDEALRAIWTLVAATNKHLADTAPWALAKAPAAGQGPPRALAVLHHTAVALDALGRALLPFLPDTAAAVLAALAAPATPPPLLFPKDRG